MAVTRRTQTRPANRSTGSRTRRSEYDQTYVYGNTVRKLAPVEDPRRRQEREPGRREQTRVNYTVRRNQERALQVDLPYLLLLVVAACCTLYICVSYLHLQSQMSARVDNIKQLEQDIELLKSRNDALETSINTSTDLDYVYQVATEQLGMVYAGRDQVLLYNKTESEYVRQNEDIPDR